MGSWAGLDANYPPGALTPASAFVVALGHLAGAHSVYADAAGACLAQFLPRQGLDYDYDLLARAERYLREVSIAEFLEQAQALLNRDQRLCLALNLLDAVLVRQAARPYDHPRLAELLVGLGIAPDQLEPYRLALAIKNDLGLFPQ